MRFYKLRYKLKRTKTIKIRSNKLSIIINEGADYIEKYLQDCEEIGDIERADYRYKNSYNYYKKNVELNQIREFADLLECLKKPLTLDKFFDEVMKTKPPRSTYSTLEEIVWSYIDDIRDALHILKSKIMIVDKKYLLHSRRRSIDGKYTDEWYTVLYNPSLKDLKECGPNCRGYIIRNGDFYICKQNHIPYSEILDEIDYFNFGIGAYQKEYGIYQKDFDSRKFELGVPMIRIENSNTFIIVPEVKTISDEIVKMISFAKNKNPKIEFILK